MGVEKEASVQIDIMTPQEIDLGNGTRGRRRRQKVDEYDYNDPFIEPMEGETQAVMIECSLEDFFVYSGQLPYSARRAMSVYKARKAREEKKDREGGTEGEKTCDRDQAAGDHSSPADGGRSTPKKTKWGRIPKGDLKTCECLASLISSELKRTRNSGLRDSEVECYAYGLALRRFQEERGMGTDLEDVEKPSSVEIGEYLERSRMEMSKVFDDITGDVHNHRLYTENFSLFKGFNKEEFMCSLTRYFLLFMKVSFLGDSDMSFNRARREMYSNVLGLFSTMCRNSSQIQHYLTKHISQVHGVENIFRTRDCEHRDTAE